MFELCASILAADFADLGYAVRTAEAAGADAFHIDIMDGHFVPAISFGPDIVRVMRALTQKPLEVHLMVEHPESYVAEVAANGADRILVHCEASNGPEAALEAIRAAGVQPGLVLNPETPLREARAYLHQTERLLLMTVRPGCGGQDYLPGSNEKIAAARALLQALHCRAVIQVDGGITAGTLPPAAQAGAGSFVAGSAVFSGDIARNVQALRLAAQGETGFGNATGVAGTAYNRSESLPCR